jgi:hypothetical protein
VRPLRAEIDLPAGCTLASGKAREEAGQLEGRAYKQTGLSFWPDLEPTGDRALVQWVVRGAKGASVCIVATHERAGTVRAEVTL